VNSGIMDQYASLLCEAGSALLIDCRSLEAERVPLELGAASLVLLVCDTRVERGLGKTAYNERRAACERAAADLGVPSLRDATTADLDRLQGDELKRARHVITEDERVLAAVEALRRNDFEELGRLMLASHVSLRDDYEVSIGQLDAAVEAAMESGALGARLTGAGFGGCAIALVPQDRTEAVTEAIRRRFRESKYQAPQFFTFEPATGAEVVS
jgi:galactokinase